MRHERGDVLLYQFATASAIAPWLAARRETLVVNYHNVTPPEYYAAWNNAMARHQLRALDERANLAPRTSLGIAVSAFNEAELRTAGYAHTAVVPPRPPSRRRPAPAAPVQLPALRAAAPPAGSALVASRPNKGIELALMALLVTRIHHDPEATLQVVGRPVVPAYSRALGRFVDELGIATRLRSAGPSATRISWRPGGAPTF